MAPRPRTSGKKEKLERGVFMERFKENFRDPSFDALYGTVGALAEIAWQNYQGQHKAPHTRPAGPGFADPTYQLSDDWRAAHLALQEAKRRRADKALSPRVLLINGSPRNDQTCPGEISKSSRLINTARECLEKKSVEVEVLDLSLVTSEYGKNIHPCKGCVSTAMPLCHFPCSCYPHHSLGQTHDWMNEIYPMWMAAHGVMLITPVHWYHVPGVLKSMMDRMVCADGGNPDPTSTMGKNATRAKELELQGWDFPRHLRGRAFSLVVHGDTNGKDQVRDNLRNWLEDMKLVHAGSIARYVDYMGHYSESHEALDRDQDLLAEVRECALALAHAVVQVQAGTLADFQGETDGVRPK